MKYEKIFIKSESDLPKEIGEYQAYSKSKRFGIWGYDCSDEDIDTWITYVAWYLKPIDQPEINMPTDVEIIAAFPHNFDAQIEYDPTQNRKRMEFNHDQRNKRIGAKWFKSEVIKRNV